VAAIGSDTRETAAGEAHECPEACSIGQDETTPHPVDLAASGSQTEGTTTRMADVAERSGLPLGNVPSNSGQEPPTPIPAGRDVSQRAERGSGETRDTSIDDSVDIVWEPLFIEKCIELLFWSWPRKFFKWLRARLLMR
jgi:hypothetical protein